MLIKGSSSWTPWPGHIVCVVCRDLPPPAQVPSLSPTLQRRHKLPLTASCC